MEDGVKPLTALLDGLDVETFVVCRNEAEGRSLMLSLLAQLGFADADIVFIEHRGPGARVRGRAYLHRPGVSHPLAVSGLAGTTADESGFGPAALAETALDHNGGQGD